ncbi:uncharacterized protein LOC122619632 isoform X1 [Drosophila teissieri]|uniref:uncharacterized protein LOC122619632 isoform X1 n=2 Tax=Drosophila teissieri TaxID=7243 RepID=UPI001CB9D83A|nr:uncharacterized protein LOC122619632 isoform X1 [Drosophila teissieri]
MEFSQCVAEIKKNSFRFILFLLILYVLISFKEQVEYNMQVRPPLEGKPDTRTLFVNSSQCQIISMDPLSPVAMYHMTEMPTFWCPMIKLMKAKSVEERNYLYLTANAKQLWQKLGVRRLSEICCAYKRFVRLNDYVNRYFESKVFRFSKWSNFTEVEPGNITLRVWCWMDYGRLVFHDVFIFLPFPKDRILNVTNSKPANRLSVLILGIDSISHMHYQRYFSRVKDLIEGLPHIELWGYNRVGQNSYPNLIPFLSGQSVDELEARSGCFEPNKEDNFDRCRFLWHDFKAAGYATIFGEDSRVAGTFTYVRPGFKRQPTDFYLRSVLNEIHMRSTYYAQGPVEIKCSGNRIYHHVLYDFIYRLLPHMQARSYDRGFFAFFWQTMGVHDYFQYGDRVDLQYYLLLRALKRRNILERTLVLILSDHGLRYGPFVDTFQGMRETSLPTMVAIYPRWLSEQYPLALANLQANAHRLVTTYDLHETLKDVIDLENLSDERILNRTLRLRNDHNISLFLPIPEERSCFSARIPLHYCQCDGFLKIPWNARSIQRIAKLAVARINLLLEPYPQCHQLALLNVEDAYLRKQHEFNKTITVRLVTQPGNGHFDATVLSKDETSLQGAITRTDQYKHQSFCAREAPIEIYCYCS